MTRHIVCFDPVRRRFLAGATAASVAASVHCGYPAESGPAFAPWDFPDPDLEPRMSLVHAAILAASPHNTQPWWFAVEADRIELSIVPERTLGEMDPLGREQVIGIGCALENLLVAAPAFGFEVSLSVVPEPDRPNLLARIALQPADAEPSGSFEMIADRHTNRGPYADLPLPDEAADAMQVLVSELAPVTLTLLRSAEDKRAFRDGTNAATRAIVDDAQMWDASHRWWRQTQAQIDARRDGLTMDISGVGAGTRVLGKASDTVSPERAGRYWIRNTEDIQLSGSAFGILSTPELEDTASLLAVGRAWQRLHLWLTEQGAAAQPLNQMAERRDRERTLGLPQAFGGRLDRLADGHAQMLFRVGYAWDEPFASPRRPVAWVSEVGA